MAATIPFSAGGSPAQITILIKLTLWLVPLALACFLGFSVYGDISALSASPESKPAQNKNTTDNNTTMSASTLASFNLLGSLGETQTPVSKNLALPETRLQLELKGAFTNTEASEASALIAASKGKPSKLYKVSETLPGGAKLHSVSTDSVTLDRAGNLEVLNFPKPKSSGSVRTSSFRSQNTSTRASDRISSQNNKSRQLNSRFR